MIEYYDKEELELQISNYLSGNSTDEEKETLLAFLASNEAAARTFREMSAVWALSSVPSVSYTHLYVEPLIQEVYNEIDKLHREPVPMEELTMVRNYMLGEMCRSYESPFSLADAWIFIATRCV